MHRRVHTLLAFCLNTADPGGRGGALYRLRGHPWTVLRRPEHLQAQRLALGAEPLPFQRGLRGQVKGKRRGRGGGVCPTVMSFALTLCGGFTANFILSVLPRV